MEPQTPAPSSTEPSPPSDDLDLLLNRLSPEGRQNLANLAEALDQGEPQFQPALDKLYGPSELEVVDEDWNGIKVYAVKSRIPLGTNPKP